MDSTQVFISQKLSVAFKTLSKNIDNFSSFENIIAEIKSDKHKAVIELLRQSDKEKRTEIKQNQLPVFYPCVFLPEYKALEPVQDLTLRVSFNHLKDGI